MDAAAAVSGSQALAYNSDTVNVLPIVETTYASDLAGPVPSQIQAQLTWGGNTQPWVTFNTTGGGPGEVYLLGLQAASPVTTTGRVRFTVEVKVAFATVTFDSFISNYAPVVANGSADPFGQGWGLSGLDSLVSVAGGVLWVSGGRGSTRFFAKDTCGFMSPPNDFGTLVQNGDGTYTYTAKDQVKWYFDSSGNLTRVVDPHGLAVTYTYAGGKLSTVAEPDGGVTTFTYGTNQYTIAEPGGRTVTATLDAGNNLTGLTNSDGGLRTFTYDSVHRLTNDRWGPLNATYSYDPGNGELSGIDRGAGTTLALVPANVQGLATNPVKGFPPYAAWTDGLNRTTDYTVDLLDRLTQRTRPDGRTEQWLSDSTGLVTTAIDVLGRRTSYTYQLGYGKGDLVQRVDPDGLGESYQYEQTFHHLTQLTDRLGRLTTYTYDPGVGDLLTVKDALNHVTTYTWSNGLLQSVTDALGHTTTYQYMAGRRLQDTIDPLGDRTTYGYDAAGNQTTVQDALGRVTTSTYDGMRRVLSVTNAAGGVTTFAYDAIGDLTSQTDELGRVTNYSYDGHGWRTAVTEAAGTAVQRISTSLYDVVGNVTGSLDPRGNLTKYQYDVLDRQTGTLDALNNQATTLYDLVGNVTGSIDARGNLTQYQYDALNRQTVVIDALGNRTTTLLDAVGNTTGVQDARGNLTQFQYDAVNRQTVTIDALGNRATTLYDAVGNVTGSIDPRGNLTQYQYDALNRRTVAIDALSNRATALYDAVGNTTGAVDARGNLTQYQYDALNRRTVAIDALSNRTTTLFDAASNTTGVIDPRGNLTQYQYDALNRRTVTIDALGNRTTTLYDLASNLTGSIDARGNLTQYQYDALNRQTVTIDALSNRATTLYDAASNITGAIDARGNLTQYQYDALNRRTVAIDALSNRATTLFDAASNVTGVIDTRGNLTQFQYDALNRQTVTIDALSNGTTTLFDAAGNVTGIIDGRSNLTQYQYDALNRRTVTTDAVGNRSTTLFDAAGNTTGVVDGRGNLTQYQYDALNRQTVTIDALSFRTTSQLDAVGNVTSVTDAKGNTTRFSYDALNRKTQVTDPFSKASTFGYDGVGNVTSATDRLGRVQNFQYDALNRLTTATWVSSGTTVNTLTYAYDPTGNLLNAANVNGAYTMTYDALDRATVVQEPFGLTLTLGYDAAGNRTLVQDSLGGVATSVYDGANNLTSRQFGGSGQTPLRIDLTYDGTNQAATATRYSDLAGQSKVGSTTYTYDADNRLSNLQHRNGTGTSLANYTYSYDKASNLQSEALNGGAPVTYTYDSVNQLTSDGSNSWAYDGTGNRTNAGYQTGTANQLTNDGTWTYTYDAEGNLTKKSKGISAETWTYGYDHRNQLLWAEDRQTDGGTLLQRLDFKYDAFGNRIEKDVTTTSTAVSRFAYDGWKVRQDGQGNRPGRVGNENWDVWADLDGSNSLQARYLRGDGVDQLLARVASGAASWFLTDVRGSVRNLTDGGGGLQDTLTYDGFGNTTAETNSSAGGRYKYDGRESDAETGLYDDRARYYDPRTGRWISQDPTWFAAGDANLYRYVGNHPTNAEDPSGLYEEDVHFYMTYYIAQAVGLADVYSGYKSLKGKCFSEAYVIAWADQFTDVHSQTSPMSVLDFQARLLYHFRHEEDSAVIAGSLVAQGPVNAGIRTGNPMLMGIGLHAYQDSWAHEGFKHYIGHMLAALWLNAMGYEGHTPDYPWWNVQYAMQMARGTYDKLLEYKNRKYPKLKTRTSFDQIADKLRGLFSSRGVDREHENFFGPRQEEERRVEMWRRFLHDIVRFGSGGDRDPWAGKFLEAARMADRPYPAKPAGIEFLEKTGRNGPSGYMPSPPITGFFPGLMQFLEKTGRAGPSGYMPAPSITGGS